MVALRKGCIAFALQCISVFLMVTLISANVIATAVTAAFTTAPGVEISRTSVSSLTNCDGVGTCQCLVLVLKSNC
jgi:hypothetical protein